MTWHRQIYTKHQLEQWFRQLKAFNPFDSFYLEFHSPKRLQCINLSSQTVALNVALYLYLYSSLSVSRCCSLLFKLKLYRRVGASVCEYDFNFSCCSHLWNCERINNRSRQQMHHQFIAHLRWWRKFVATKQIRNHFWPFLPLHHLFISHFPPHW